MTSNHDNLTRSKNGGNREARIDLIVQSARTLYERQGHARTTVRDIAAEAGMTRELVYYYFANKQAITEAVLDAFVRDFVDSVALWCDEPKTIPAQTAFTDFIEVFRRGIFKKDGAKRPMHRVLVELNRQVEIFQRVVDECSHYLENDRLFSACSARVGVSVRDMTAFALFGTIGLLEIDSEVDDETVARLVEDTFKIDDPEESLCDIIGDDGDATGPATPS